MAGAIARHIVEMSRLGIEAELRLEIPHHTSAINECDILPRAHVGPVEEALVGGPEIRSVHHAILIHRRENKRGRVEAV